MIVDKRGQISGEFILIISFVVIIILVFASFIGPQIEENNIISAAREGASSAVTEITYSNVSMQPIRLEGIIVTGEKDKSIILNFDRPLPENYKAFVINRTVESILRVGGSRVGDNKIKVSDRIYTIMV
ncbi:MAG: hypothetical protein QFX38_06075 [Methanothermobacter sp.]|nr:hypothetical protein [Methanothermobacter sp.]